MNLTSSPHRRKRHSSGEEDVGTGFSAAMRRAPPPVPPALLRRIGVKEVTGVGKVKVMLRVFGGAVSGPATGATASGSCTTPGGGSASFFSVDSRRKQVTLFDPAACGSTATPEDRRVGVAAPKMFAFDAIFTQEDSQTEVCSGALSDVIHAVINGTDGCLFCFGHARLGKTYTMVGSPEASGTLGVIPCAISWLFRGINEQKQKTGARFSVRVSAVEVLQQSGGTSQQLRDLLAGHANDCEQSPGVYLRDDPLFGTQLQNQSELRVPTAEKAAFYLDAAISSRSGCRSDGTSGGPADSHLLYTLHVYQYSVAGKGHGVAGGRSRLHLIDLGSCERGKAHGGIPLSGLGNVLLAIFNGQKHLPYREHKVTQLLKECLSSLTCHAAMIAHVSPAAQHYTDTLATVQLASRIHRMRRRKIKFSGGSAGSGGSSGEEAAVRLQQTQENGRSTGSSDVDPSSSEQSADTVIYVGPSDDAATDGEHPPVYIPSLNSGDNRCAMGKALRGSSAEHRLPSNSGSGQQGKSASSSPAKTNSAQSKLPNGSVVEDRSSPSHRGSSTKSSTNQLNSKTSSPSHNSSCKSSPVRTLSKMTPHKTSSSLTDQQLSSSTQSQTSSKIPVPFSNACGNAAGTVSGSDEQWIDGPRISKSKVAEARSLLKDSHKKKETWIDGPLQTGKLPALGNGHASGSYGFMDSHKKSMIRKWVENQTVQIQRQTVKNSTSAASPRPPTTGAPQGHTYKELTVFKTCEDETESPGGDAKSSSEVEPRSSLPKDETVCLGVNRELVVAEGVEHVEDNQRTNERSSSEAEVDTPGEQDTTIVETEPENVEEEDDVVGDIPPPLQLFQPHNKEIITDVSVDSLDVRLRTIHERREAAGAVGKMDDDNDEDEVEIIEVEEPFETVPMQDSCLQVTEEDIALCMGEIENPLPEVDQESNEEHPLRILSQENLTVVSTFTDSMSVVTDLERMLPHHQFGHSEGTLPNHRPYSLYELPDDYIGRTELRLFDDGTSENKRQTPDLISNQTKFEQLARLHEMYKTKLARANVTKTLSSNLSPSLQYRPPSRCQSLSMSDMLYGSGNPDSNYTSVVAGAGGGSIYSEPAYNVHKSLRQNQAKICDNCKMSFSHTGNGSSWYQPLMTKTTWEHIPMHHPLGSMVCDSVNHRFCRGGCNISSLRHPDGASNPNLKEEVERVPGNGASTSDHEEETSERQSKSRQTPKQEVRTVTGKAHDEEEEEDEPPPVLPPSLPPAPSSTRLHRRLFGAKTGTRHASPRSPCPAIGPEGYDSGHDSSSPSPRPTKASQLASCLPGVLSGRRPAAAAILSAVQCESSGYESIVRDSECSSFGSSQDSDPGEPHDPGGSKKVPVLQYCREDVERLERRWTEAQGRRIRELRAEQQELKQELAAAKTRLLIPSTRWSYELHVEASMDCRDPSFLEALVQETQILQKRVEACKSHILMVTCFDAVLKQQD
ncbi:kinesin-like protein GA13060 isoform X2 [Zootermopsis nevadensis]|nr:kinesin-like protein GA13060 isoform X2 [Zootermopsis nevadensis]